MSELDDKLDAAEVLLKKVGDDLFSNQLLFTPTQGLLDMQCEWCYTDEFHIYWKLDHISIVTARLSIRRREVRFHVSCAGMRILPDNINSYEEAYRCAGVVKALVHVAKLRFSQD